jgi:hypothetical protein
MGRAIRIGLIGIASLVVLFAVVGTLVFSVLRDKFYDLYMERLDKWVNDGGAVTEIQEKVVENCGKLIISQAGAVERIQLETVYRDEFDFRVDVCTKITVNRLYKQPEFEKAELVNTICDTSDSYHELFGRLCRHDGLRPTN